MRDWTRPTPQTNAATEATRVRRGSQLNRIAWSPAHKPTAVAIIWTIIAPPRQDLTMPDGRPVAVMANDPTVKAGSWGPKTVEKIIRLIELARRRTIPIVYLVDSAGARITDQVEMFPGRRGAGKIFYNQVQASGRIPQVCCLFGPSAAGGAYIPAFCDVVFMVEKNASMYLGSPRMAEEVIGERVSLEEMGGARMHSEVSGSGDLLVPDDKAAIPAARAYLSDFPSSWEESPPSDAGRAAAYTGSLSGIVPEDESKVFDMYALVAGLVDEE